MTNKELLEYCRELEMRINDLAVEGKTFGYELATKVDRGELEALRGATEATIDITDKRLSAIESAIRDLDPSKAKKELLLNLIEIFERMYEEL